jgi:hypothetical protein
MEIISILIFFLAALSTSFLWNFNKKNEFLENEADRNLNNFCEIDKNWNSNGKMYTKGLAVIMDEKGSYRFIKQAKLCDIGILS